MASKIVDRAIDARYSQVDEEPLAREHLERKRIPQAGERKRDRARDASPGHSGFSTGVIYKILRQWDVPDETLAALENLEESSPEE